VQEEIQGINVIVERLLEVNAVRPDLAFGFGEDNVKTFLLPSGCRRNFRTKGANKKESDSFTN